MLDLARFREHLTRVKSSVLQTIGLKDIPAWICENTFIKGEHYSFKGHEFQQTIISDESQELNVQKCAQIGLSEIMARWIVAVCYNYPNFNAIVTFPFSGDATDFARTRVDPFIANSPKLKEAMNADLDNSEVKQILQSQLRFRGTNGKTAAISIPADCIVSDEVDRSDPHILTQFTSRVMHSAYKWRRNFSTPTIAGYGIDLFMQSSRRMKNLCKCSHCSHWFLPSFFQHVKIPGYDNELQALNKNTLSKTRFLEAKLLCPACGVEPSLLPEHRQYVLENDTAQHDAAGYYVSPFDAPTVITPVDLLRAMVKYARKSEFINQNLGLTSEEVSESLMLGDITQAIKIGVDLRSDTVHAMGCDMGLICYIAIGRLTLEGQLIVVHRESVVLGNFEEKRRELARRYRVGITVCDSQPYVDMILRMQRTDKNLFGGVFVESKSMEVYSIKMVDAQDEKGKLPIHQARINRDKALDELLGLFKNKEIVIQAQTDELDEEYEKHLLDMKRVQEFDSNQELTYTWVKSSTQVDHWHFTTLYLYTACRLRGTINRDGLPLAGVPVFLKFKAKEFQRPVPKGLLTRLG